MWTLTHAGVAEEKVGVAGWTLPRGGSGGGEKKMKKQEPGVELCHRRMGCNLGKKIDYNSRGTGSADYESRGDSIPGAGREGIRLAQGDATSDQKRLVCSR